jgi:uncharacterized DUF497 family protein
MERKEAVSNARKHGVSFEEASTIFGDEQSLTIEDPSHTQSEERFATMGRSYRGRLLVVVHTGRGDQIHRKQRLDVADLYRLDGRYRYSGSFSGVALTSLALAILPNIPGVLATIKVLPQTSVAPIFLSIYRYAWFVGFALAFLLYLVGRKIAPDQA